MNMPSKLDQSKSALEAGRFPEADRLVSVLANQAIEDHDSTALRTLWPILTAARTHRRVAAAAGRIDLHTHTTASDGELTVEQSLCDHFRQGQILINDHNIIDSLAEARRLVHERDLPLDVFCGIEVICTKQRRAFEFMAITPTLSNQFIELCLEHRNKWDLACELFVKDFVDRNDFFSHSLWQKIGHDHELGGPFTTVIKRYHRVHSLIKSDPNKCDEYLANNKTFDMGNLWSNWRLGEEGDPPQLNHRVFGSMRCYAMNAYDEIEDWFDYDKLTRRFKEIGCVISHNHPNYWDEDFIGELHHKLQTEWIRDWAQRKMIDALEVWSPPFASKRVPDYWEKVCRECELIPMSGTDCHNGKEQELGGQVDNHPEIPPMIYHKLSKTEVELARCKSDGWPRIAAWWRVLGIDYAQAEALREIASSLDAAVEK